MRVRIGVLALYGAVIGLLFGAVSNLYFWPLQANGTAASWEPHASLATNVQHYATFYVTTSLPWDIWRTMGNVVMVLLLGRLGLAALDRAAKRMRLDIVPDIDDEDPRTDAVTAFEAVSS
jgi:energy-coupling factor transport system substrate-specific component